jgi:hypothetical protein
MVKGHHIDRGLEVGVELECATVCEWVMVR